MASKKVEVLEGEMSQLKEEVGEKLSSLEGKFSSLEERFGGMEEMIRKLVDAQVAQSNPKEKGKSPMSNPNPNFSIREDGASQPGEAMQAPPHISRQEPWSREGWEASGVGGALWEGTAGQGGGAVRDPHGPYGGWPMRPGGVQEMGRTTWEPQGGWSRGPGGPPELGRATGEVGGGWPRQPGGAHEGGRAPWEPPRRGVQTPYPGEWRGRPQWEGFQHGPWEDGRNLPRTDTRMRKLKVPVFEGEDAYGWVYRVERYFAVNGVTEEEKLMAVPICLEGKSLAWFQWIEGRQPIRSWEEFKDLLLHRFRVSSEGTHYEQFMSLVQEGTVAEYRERFELLSGRLRGMPDDAMEGNFMKGLKPYIRAAIRVVNPRGIVGIMETAQLVEDKQKADQTRKSGGSHPTYRSPLMLEGPKVTATTHPEEVKLEKATTVMNQGGFKRLTDSELKEKRVKGLCYRCDEKFAPGHRCKEKTLHVIVVGDSDGDTDEGATMEKLCEVEHPHLDMIEVSLNSMEGLPFHPTMKMEGEIEGCKVRVLFDSGATHNSLAYRVAEQLSLEVIASKEVEVTICTGQKARIYGKCKGVTIILQGEVVTQDFLLIDLENADAILGMQWLQSLGDMEVNWEKLMVKYNSNGRRVALQGDPSLCGFPTTEESIFFNLEDKVNFKGGSIDTGRRRTAEGRPATPASSEAAGKAGRVGRFAERSRGGTRSRSVTQSGAGASA
ncbi:hypothetical protein KFK09_016881 [Dendrobium nobile]|uniref:Retrotransposon gag domain-containing protein n=1 Tax=Dendrobium nobile TaxID=94219 RepID=A0A8T3AZE1_DENNO|nr:hypothetical protein KFK09_016881 [Dendrobium nobile]